ncbi:hypothetical protein DCC79_02155 [bacterium]|nr:MAG: hypothetical protein DCC79_02155 [bacterium]
MLRSDLFASLKTGPDDITLTPQTPVLGDLAAPLADIVDAAGHLEITGVTQARTGPRDRLTLEGRAVVFGQPMAVRAVFQLGGGFLRAYHLVATPAADWSLRKAFPKLAPDVAGAGLLDVPLVRPVIVVSAGAPPITDARAELQDAVLEDGVHLLATATAGALPLERFLPAPAHAVLEKVKGRPAGRVQGTITQDMRRPALALTWWWPVRGATQPGPLATPITAVGLAVDTWLDAGLPGAPAVAWRQEVAPADGGPPIHLGWPWSAGAQPDFTAVLDAPRVAGDADHLAPLMADPAVGALPGGLALTALSHGPASVSFTAVLWDRANARPAEWEALPGLVRFHEASAHVHVPLADPGDKTIVVFGSATLLDCEGLTFDLELVPGRSLRASLHRPEHLDPTAVLERFLGQPTGLPHVDLALLSLTVEHDLVTKDRAVAASLGGHLDLVGNGLVVVEGVDVRIASTAGQVTARAIAGSLELAGIAFNLTGTWSAPLGWLIQGGLGRGVTVPLDRLVKDVLHRFDAELPFDLPVLDLGRLGVAFATRTRDFRAYAQTRWTPPSGVPWASGEIDVGLEVQVEKAPGAASRSVAVILDWAWESGGRTFDAHALFAAGGPSVSASWVAPDDTRLGLADLFRALKLDALAGLPAGHDWTLFAFREAMAYLDLRERRLQLRAVAPLGKGVATVDAVLGRDGSQFEAEWIGADAEARIGVDTLLEAVGLRGDPVLDEVEKIGRDVFSFHRVSFSYVSAPDPTLLFVCQTAHAAFDQIFVAARRAAGQWGVVVGASFRAHTRLGDVKVLGEIPFVGDIAKALVVEPVYVIASSIDAASFPTPPVADPAGDLPFRKGNLQVRKGLSLAVTLDIGQSPDAAIRRVRDVVGLDRLEGKLGVGPGHAEVFAKIPGTLRIPTGLAGDLALVDPYLGLIFQTGGPAFRLGGAGSARLFGADHAFKVAMTVSPEALDGSAYQKDGVPLPAIPALPGLRIKRDYWIELGVDFEPTGVDFGFQGQFYIGDDPAKYTGDLAIVLTFVEEVPDPQYLAASIDTLDLWAMFELQTGMMRTLAATEERMGAVAAGADAVAKTDAARAAGAGAVAGAAAGAARLGASGLEFLRGQYKNLQSVLRFIRFDDVAFHFCERPGVILPDGTPVPLGLGFRGWADICGWRAFSRLEVSTSSSVPQISGELQLAPIALAIDGFDVLRITGDGKGVVKPALTPKALTQRDAIGRAAPPPPARPEFLVPPGGPNLIVSSQHSPFLHADLEVELLGVLHASAKADVTDKGFDFRLHGGIGDLAHVDLGCSLQTEGGVRFDAHGAFGMHLNLDTGPIIPGLDFTAIHLDAGLDASLTLSVTKDDFRLSVDGSFAFEGATFDLPTLTIDVPFGSLKELPGKVLAWIKDKAAAIFVDLFHGIGEALEAAGKEVAAIAEAGAKLCEEAYAKASAAIKDVGETVGRAASAAAHEVEKIAGEVADKVKAIASAAASAVLDVGRAAAAEAKLLLDAGEAALKDAGRAVAAAAAAVADEVARIGHRIADIAGRAAAAVADIARAAAAEIAAIAHEAEQVAAELLHAAQAVVDGLESAARQVWDEINAIVDKAKQVGRTIEHAGEDLWHAATSWL